MSRLLSKYKFLLFFLCKFLILLLLLIIKVIASPGNRATEIPGMEESCDHVARLIAAVLRLCEVERRASDSGLAHLLSPEMGSTVVWWLRRFALTYLLPNENLYVELSPSFAAAFGRDSEGANWITSFLLNKVESNLRTQTAEPALMDETLKLLMALVDTKEKRSVVIKSGPVRINTTIIIIIFFTK